MTVNRPAGRALALCLGLLVGATAGASFIFFLPRRQTFDLMNEQSAVTPTNSLPESVENGPETARTAVQEKAETTAAHAVQSARAEEGLEPQERPENATRGEHHGGGGVADGRDELLELLAGEARTAATRLGAENEALRRRAEEAEARNELLGKRLAEAMAALDAEMASGMPAAPEATPGDGPVEGLVVGVNEELGLAVVDRGSRHGVRHGLPLTVLRGRRKVARLRVVDVRETLSGAAIEEAEPGNGPQAGDRAILARTGAGPEGN